MTETRDTVFATTPEHSGGSSKLAIAPIRKAAPSLAATADRGSLGWATHIDGKLLDWKGRNQYTDPPLIRDDPPVS